MTNVPGLDLSGALVAFRWQSIGLDRTIAVYDDGAIRCWQLSAIEAEFADVAGAFRIDADSSELSAARAIAARIESASVAGLGSASGQHGELGLNVTVGNVSHWVGASDPLAAEIGGFVQPLVSKVLQAPLSALRLGGALLPAPATPDDPPQGAVGLAVSFRSAGSVAVTFTVDPNAITVELGNAGWQQVVPPRMGVLSGDGNLIDGIYVPAVIAAGTLGVMMIGAPAGGTPTSVRVNGTITLTGPWPYSPELGYQLSAPCEDRR